MHVIGWEGGYEEWAAGRGANEGSSSGCAIAMLLRESAQARASERETMAAVCEDVLRAQGGEQVLRVRRPASDAIPARLHPEGRFEHDLAGTKHVNVPAWPAAAVFPTCSLPLRLTIRQRERKERERKREMAT